ncbi:MAG: hypothetical protein GC201_07590 [Alphaproteobacteria bacterium]|nr:hypothetical protein [Alphaproteobacteria bacterium]
MYAVMPVANPNILALRVCGKLTADDHRSLHPWLDVQIEAHHCPSLLVVTELVPGDGPDGLDTVRLDLPHHQEVRRLALVGEQSCRYWMTWFARPFSAEVRYFDRGEVEDAEAWVAVC